MGKLTNLQTLDVTFGNREIINVTSDVGVTSLECFLITPNRQVIRPVASQLQGDFVSASITLEPEDIELTKNQTVILELRWDIGTLHFQNTRMILNGCL